MLGTCPGVVVLGLVLLQYGCGMTSVYLWGGGQWEGGSIQGDWG